MVKKLICVIVSMLLFATAIMVAGDANNNEQNSDPIKDVDWWTMFGHDAQNTGYSTSTAPETDEVMVSQRIGDTLTFGSPVVVDEKIYFTDINGILYSAEAFTGDLIFEKDLGVPILRSSAAVVDGYIYVHTGSGESAGLSCFDVNDVTYAEWEFITGGSITNEPTIANGKVYFGDRNKEFYCLDTDGNKLWNFTASGEIYSTPAISEDKVYFTSQQGQYSGPSTIYCLDDTSLGAEIWSYTRDTISKSPVIYEDKIYVGSGDTLICLDADGNGDLTTDLIWSYTIPDTDVTSPGAADGKIYFGTNDNEFYCLDADGNGDLTTDLIWNHQATFTVSMPPAIADGKVYFNTQRGIYCVDADGNGDLTTNQYWWKFSTKVLRTQPAIAAGNVWMVADEGSITGFGVNDNEPPETPDQPSGPTEGFVGIDYTYTTDEVTDPDGDDVEYLFDFGDSFRWWNESASASHIWTEVGIYEVKVIARDTSFNLESNWSENLTVTITNDPPLTPDAPEGPNSGDPNMQYSFTASTTDPNDHQIFYTFSWDDQASDEYGPFDSGEECTASHLWIEIGTYNVTVMATDEYGAESDWSDPLVVTISELPEFEINISGGNAITVELTNVGNFDATNVDLVITIEGGFIILTPREQTEQISSLEPDESITVTMEVFGIGLGILTEMPTITVTVDCDEGVTLEETVQARILFKNVTLQ